MIFDQPTQTTPLVPTADTQLATLDALRGLLARYPGLPALDWHLDADRPGHITAVIGPNARTTVSAFHALFGGHTLTGKPSAATDGTWSTSHSWFGTAGGLDFYLYGTDPVDTTTETAAAA